MLEEGKCLEWRCFGLCSTKLVQGTLSDRSYGSQCMKYYRQLPFCRTPRRSVLCHLLWSAIPRCQHDGVSGHVTPALTSVAVPTIRARMGGKYEVPGAQQNMLTCPLVCDALATPCKLYGSCRRKSVSPHFVAGADGISPIIVSVGIKCALQEHRHRNPSASFLSLMPYIEHPLP